MQMLSIVISVLALLISACGFWFQYLYRADEVSCLVTKFSVRRWEGFSEPSLHVAIGNSGTNSIMLREATFSLAHKTGTSLVGIPNATWVSYELPMLIEKGSILTIELRQLLKDQSLSHFQEQYLSTRKEGELGPFDFHLTLGFVTIAGNEIRYSEPVAIVKLRRNNWSDTEMMMTKNKPWKLAVRRFWQDFDVI